MKQVNLKEFNITGLRFTFWVDLPDDLWEKIRGVTSQDKEGDCVFADRYKIGNVSHFALALVSKSKGERRYGIRVMWERESLTGVGKGIASVSKLFEIISCIKGEVAVNCSLRLSFGRPRKYKTIISLPIKITDMPEAIYDEILGMHFVKREGKGYKYDVILDLERKGAVMMLINYRKLMNIKESMLEDILQEGIKISDGFVLREKK
jgi:hypothetical protein